jgi:hypothetical protein
MIKLKNLLAETRTSMKFESDSINFTITSKGASVILIPDSKGLDTIDKIKSNIGSGNKDKIFDQFVINRLQRTTGIKFERDTKYPGAGYAYAVDMDELIKKIS